MLSLSLPLALTGLLVRLVELYFVLYLLSVIET